MTLSSARARASFASYAFGRGADAKKCVRFSSLPPPPFLLLRRDIILTSLSARKYGCHAFSLKIPAQKALFPPPLPHFMGLLQPSPIFKPDFFHVKAVGGQMWRKNGAFIIAYTCCHQTVLCFPSSKKCTKTFFLTNFYACTCEFSMEKGEKLGEKWSFFLFLRRNKKICAARSDTTTILVFLGSSSSCITYSIDVTPLPSSE